MSAEKSWIDEHLSGLKMAGRHMPPYVLVVLGAIFGVTGAPATLKDVDQVEQRMQAAMTEALKDEREQNAKLLQALHNIQINTTATATEVKALRRDVNRLENRID